MLKSLSFLTTAAVLTGCIAVPADYVYVTPTPVYIQSPIYVPPPVIYSPPVYIPYRPYHRPRVYRHGSWIY